MFRIEGTERFTGQDGKEAEKGKENMQNENVIEQTYEDLVDSGVIREEGYDMSWTEIDDASWYITEALFEATDGMKPDEARQFVEQQVKDFISRPFKAMWVNSGEIMRRLTKIGYTWNEASEIVDDMFEPTRRIRI